MLLRHRHQQTQKTISLFFTDKEQTALALAEAVTLVSHGDVPDDVYARAVRHSEEQELAQLLANIFTINTWNRLAITTAKVPGTDERVAH